MKIDVLTLFPKMFEGFLSESIIKRALTQNKVEINIHNIRDYTLDPHKKVDDYGFGGGAGMVLMPQPIFDAVDALKTNDSYVILVTPQGNKYNQKKAYSLTSKKHIIIVCGHYEGFDERIKTRVDEVISIGDYILTGGEIPAMAITDSITRLIPGVITNKSLLDESFNDSLLDYPTYTKPAEYRGLKVPDVLTSGNHQKINEYRATSRIEKTKALRPDLMEDNND